MKAPRNPFLTSSLSRELLIASVQFGSRVNRFWREVGTGQRAGPSDAGPSHESQGLPTGELPKALLLFVLGPLHHK